MDDLVHVPPRSSARRLTGLGWLCSPGLAGVGRRGSHWSPRYADVTPYCLAFLSSALCPPVLTRNLPLNKYNVIRVLTLDAARPALPGLPMANGLRYLLLHRLHRRNPLTHPPFGVVQWLERNFRHP